MTAASQIPRILRNIKVHYHVHKILALVRTWTRQVQSTSPLTKFHFVIIYCMASKQTIYIKVETLNDQEEYGH